MEYKREYVELTENIIKTSPGFRGNEDLLDEIVGETLKKSRSFLECSMDTASLEIYIKKIAGNVIVDILKNAEAIRAEKTKQTQANEAFEEMPVSYETDEEGKILYNFELPAPEKARLTEDKINAVKEKVIELDRINPLKNYGQIFEMRFVKEMAYPEIAKKLDMNENEAAKSLFELLTEIDSA